ncbi:MAG: hypothetical protein ABS82_01005 [Rhodanobacter sp. SCN 67-45]|nr:MAG: hypothetical protein ABS82_01005 [Rhodanobacter sp. SCN 67-45]
MRDIRLLLPHTHADRDYPPDAVLTVDDATADWLRAQHIGVVAPPDVPDTRGKRHATDKISTPHHADTDTTGDDHEH